MIAGNWKMNKNLEEGKSLVSELLTEDLGKMDNRLVIIAPPYIHLSNLSEQIKNNDQIHLAAQNCHQEESGAYTGEISAKMLQSVGVSFVILGHSERRQYFNEDADLLSKKVDAVLKENMEILFCVGEPLEIRDGNRQNDYVSNQIKESLFHLNQAEFKRITIAYEPIWAIGTGRTASAQQAQDMHAHIRSFIAGQYGQEVANHTSILYGGSCNPKNAQELFAQKDVDGGLIGGASLKSEDFASIVKSF